MNLRILLIFSLFNIGLGEVVLCANEIPESIYTEIPDGFQQKLNKDENDDYYKAWMLLNQGEGEKALNIAKRYYEFQKQSGRWAILLGAIYLGERKYEDAVNIISVIRPAFEKVYTKVKNKKIQLKENELKALKFLYYKMLLVSGGAHYELGNWATALPDLLEYSKEFQKSFVYEYIGMIYYKNKQYTEAILYFKNSYQLLGEGELKDNAAFSIAAFYSLLGNVEDAISWLKIPLSHNKKYWLQMIKDDEDKDFETIRNNKQFEDFLKQQEIELNNQADK
jgi:tetratricopeptide (TPR) repeat protein